jgi:hypothetical protein
MSNPNRKRAKRAARTLSAAGYRDHGLEWYSALSDCLKDMRHLADAIDVDFDSIVEWSQEGYQQEVDEDSPSGGRAVRADDFAFEVGYQEVPFAEPRGKSDCKTVRRAKPFAHSVEDVDSYFRDCEGLTFIFLAYDRNRIQANTVSPDVLSAIALAKAAFAGADYVSPYNGWQNETAAKGRGASKTLITSGVQARIKMLKKWDTDFVLIWNIAGESAVHVDGDLNELEANLIDLLESEVRELLR